MNIDTVGKTLFGHPVRLKLCLWISQHDNEFFQSQPPRDVGDPTAIRQSIQKLEQLRMIKESRRSDDRRIYYRKTASPLWKIIAAVDEALPAIKRVRAP